MNFVEETITLSDGRTLETSALGDPSGGTVFFHHGTPGSARLVKNLASMLDHENLFLVSTSRAGYGRSTRNEGRDIAAVVADTRAALDHYQRDEYVALGWSGGGPHALACAALDAPRCRAGISVAGVVPIDVDFDWTEGMGPENVEEFKLAAEGGPAYDAHMELVGSFLADATSENIIELFGGLLSEPDRAALGDENGRSIFADATAHGFLNGSSGFYDDDRAMFKSWGFDPAAITVPVSVYYGDRDLMVPPTHGAWLVEHLPTATAFHHPEEGHVSLVANHTHEIAARAAGAFA